MKSLLVLIAMLTPFFLISCGGTTGTSNSLTGRTIVATDYGSTLESAYYKMWSDSTWEEFGRIVTVDSTTYATIVDDAGYEYYYSSQGYAGFCPSGGSLILFDEPIPSLPDTLVFGKTYTQQTTFTSQGTAYTMKIVQTLQDTGTVTVGFGTFYDCLSFKSQTTLSGGGSSNVTSSQYWLAKGPSELKRESSSGAVSLMLYGYVNGQSWGEGLPKRSPGRAAGFRPEMPIHLLHLLMTK